MYKNFHVNYSVYNLKFVERNKGDIFDTLQKSSIHRFDVYFLDLKDGDTVYQELLGVIPIATLAPFRMEEKHTAYMQALSPTGKEPTSIIDETAISIRASYLDEHDVNEIIKSLYLADHLRDFIIQSRRSGKEIIFNVISESSLILDIPWHTINIKGQQGTYPLKTQAYILRHVSKADPIIQIRPFDLTTKHVLVCTPPLEDQEDIRTQIEAEIAFLSSLSNVTVKVVYCANLDDVAKALGEMPNVDVFHYTGHGDTYWVDINSAEVDDVYEVLKKSGKKPRLVVLNCCLSAFTSSSAQQSLAFKLLGLDSVSNVLSFRYTVDTIISQQFVEKFYNYLLTNKDVYQSYLLTIKDDRELLDNLLLYGK